MLSPSDVRILLVEDNPGDADLIEAYLEPDPRVNARIIRAETLGEAVGEVASSSGLDIVLLDLTLPDSEGIGTLDRLREVAPRLPIILLTGSQNEELVWAAIQRGADDYLPKNELTPDLLARSIRYTLDRADAERAVRQREEWFRSLVENVTDLVVTVDARGRLRYVSPSQGEILGHDVENRRGGNILDIVHPEQRHRAAEALRRLSEGADAVEFELEVRTAAGDWRVVAGDARNLLESDAVRGIVVTGRDITDAVERERELRRKDAILEAVSVASEELLSAGDLEEVLTGVLEALGRATGVGKVELWAMVEPGSDEGGVEASAVSRWTREDHPVPESGYSRLFTIDADWQARLRRGEIVHLARDEASGADRDILEEEQVASVALIPVTADGALWGVLRFLDRRRSHGWSEAEVDALGAAGAILGAAVQRRSDEAKIRERDQELLRAQKMEAVGRLAGGIAHDFNNLLTAIGGYASFIGEHMADDDSVADEVREIERAADRGGRLTKQLLAFSRQQVVDERVFEPGVVVSEIEPLLTRLIGEDIRLTTDTGESGCPIRMDPSQLEQILMNLVLNARDAVEEGGAIDITVESVEVGPDASPMLPDAPPAGRYARVAVRDDGGGMDAETRERVFEPFFTTKEQGEGTGLGLATVYGIVEGVGGYIDLVSEPGQGTRVEILFPATDGELPTDREEAPRTATEDASGTVLVVEDEDGVRGVAVRSLERRGYAVIDAENGRQALDKVDELDIDIDVVLTDVVMPEVGGVELAKELRRRFPAVKVLLTSGYTQDELVQKGLDDHELDFIPKPYTPAELAAKVAAVMRQEPQTAQYRTPPRAGPGAAFGSHR